MIARAVVLGLMVAAVVLSMTTAPAQESRPTSRPAGEEPTPVSSRGGLVFTGREGWLQHEPTNRMRVVSYTLPGETEDADPAELAVYYFGPRQGGSVEANLKRWYLQFRQPDGGSTEEAAEVEEVEVEGMKVTLVDVSGTYVARARPGAGDRRDEPNQRMLAAIVEAPGGHHYLKLVGPAEAVTHQAEAFRAFVEAIQLEQ